MGPVVDYLHRFRYLAMFTILVLCGLGLPLPEEVTLLGAGLLVGWGEAQFLPSALACVSAIILGDCLIFFMGRFFGRQFLQSRFMRWIVNRKRQARVRHLFARHGHKAVFVARFFAGVRIGVYAYAGQHGMKWYRFLLLDLAGALISGPTSIFIGKVAAEQMGSPQAAVDEATRLAHAANFWIWAGVVVLILVFVGVHLVRRRRRKRKPVTPAPSVSACREPVAPSVSGVGSAHDRDRDRDHVV